MEPTSNSGRKSARKTPSAPSTEDYLGSQIHDARLALESSLDDLKLDLSRAADLRRWVRRYPWAALGTALAAGFTLSYVVTKSKQRSKDSPTSDTSPPEEFTGFTAAAAPTRKSSPAQEPPGAWRGMILSALFDIVRLVVTQIVSATIRQATVPTAPASAAPDRDNQSDSRPRASHAAPTSSADDST